MSSKYHTTQEPDRKKVEAEMIETESVQTIHGIVRDLCAQPDRQIRHKPQRASQKYRHRRCRREHVCHNQQAEIDDFKDALSSDQLRKHPAQHKDRDHDVCDRERYEWTSRPLMLATQNANKDQRYRERYAPDFKSAGELVFRKIEQDVSQTTKQKHQRGESFPHLIRQPRNEERRGRL